MPLRDRAAAARRHLDRHLFPAAEPGAGLPLTLKKVDRVSEARRPQMPKRPYPYQEEAVSYENRAGGVTLAGTLTLPEGPGPFPAVLLITGSGPQCARSG